MEPTIIEVTLRVFLTRDADYTQKLGVVAALADQLNNTNEQVTVDVIAVDLDPDSEG